jgi:hypothetical protein
MYKHEKKQNALGDYYKFTGPGLDDYEELMLIQELNDWAIKCEKDAPRGLVTADCVAGMLQRAFNAGKAKAKKELRQWLEVER